MAGPEGIEPPSLGSKPRILSVERRTETKRAEALLYIIELLGLLFCKLADG